jgi:sugar phosphate isomerase/epimerase
VTEGVLPLDRFLDALVADGYSGTITLEVDLRRSLADAEALRRALVANREFCASRLPLVA